MNLLSIAICTYNRYSLLAQNLQRLQLLGYTDRFEIIVVDNSEGIDGRTEFDVPGLESPNISYVTLSPPGLSRARNKALEQAHGDIIAFLDDDVRCLSGWAEALLSCFSDPTVVCAGGPVSADPETEIPFWVSPELRGALSCIDLGPNLRNLLEFEYLVGANMAFRRSSVLAACGFDERLGRVKERLLSNEDVGLQDTLWSMGKRTYHPHAGVAHWIPSDRLSVEWYLKRYANQGLSDELSNRGTSSFHESLLYSEHLPPVYRAFYQDLMSTPPSGLSQRKIHHDGCDARGWSISSGRAWRLWNRR